MGHLVGTRRYQIKTVRLERPGPQHLDPTRSVKKEITMLRNTIILSLSCSLFSVACDDDISFRAGGPDSDGTDSNGYSSSGSGSGGDSDSDSDSGDGGGDTYETTANEATGGTETPPVCDPLGNPALSDGGEGQWVQTQDHVVQTFTPCDGLDLAYVNLPLRTCSDNGFVKLTLELRATKMDGTPADEVIETSGEGNTSWDVIDNCNGGPFQNLLFKFYNEPHLNAGATYALVLKASPIAPDTSSYGSVEWQRNYNFNPNPYAFGTYWHRFQWGNWITPWTGNSNYDLHFELGELPY